MEKNLKYYNLCDEITCAEKHEEEHSITFLAEETRYLGENSTKKDLSREIFVFWGI